MTVQPVFQKKGTGVKHAREGLCTFKNTLVQRITNASIQRIRGLYSDDFIQRIEWLFLFVK